MRGPDRNGGFTLIGTPELAARLRHSGLGKDGSRYAIPDLVGLLYGGTPVSCTFDPEEASAGALELLSARHPMVKLALEVLGEEDLALPRFGSVIVPGLPAGRRLLVSVDLATTSGLRPLIELWTTAVDLDTGELVTEAGDLLLTALAEGTLDDGPDDVPEAVPGAWRQAREYVSERRLRTERSRSQENEALVEARVQARESSLDIQIRKAEELIERLRADGRGDGIIRLHQGRIRNLRADRRLVAENMARHRRLGVRLTPVAAVLTAGPEARTPGRGTRRS